MKEQPKKNISIIVAAAENGVIGRDNKLIWRLSEDLKRFKKLTTGHAIIMGRKTFDSIGKPLPNRLNIVISRSKDLKIDGCEVVDNIETAIQRSSELQGASEIFIIGGGKIYEQTLSLASKIYFTKVHARPEGDTYFPPLTSEWQETHRDKFTADEKNEFDFDIIVYERNGTFF